MRLRQRQLPADPEALMFGPFGLGNRPFYRTKPLPVLHRFWLHFRDKGEHGIMECMALDHDDARAQARKARLGFVLVEQKA